MNFRPRETPDSGGDASSCPSIRKLVMTVLSQQLQEREAEWAREVDRSFAYDGDDPPDLTIARMMVNREINLLVIVVGDRLLTERIAFADWRRTVEETWSVFISLPASFHRMLLAARARSWARSLGMKGVYGVEKN
jgi:hypothetical protein